VIAIVGGVAATVLADLLIPPVRRFLRAAGRFALRVLGAGFAVSVPAWVLVVTAAVAAFVARATSVPLFILVIAAVLVVAVVWIGRRVAPATKVYDVTTRTYGPPRARVEAPAVRPVLSELEDAIVRRLARADGAWLHKGDLSSATRTTALRVGQALDHLETAGVVESHFSTMSGRSYGLTRDGRDFAIERKYI